MKNKLRLKYSVPFIICCIMVAILSVSIFYYLIALAIDFRSIDDLSDEYKNELVDDYGFRMCTIAVSQALREHGISLDSITKVEYRQGLLKDGFSYSHKSPCSMVIVKYGQEDYLHFLVNGSYSLELMSDEKIDEYRTKLSRRQSDNYGGVELRLIKQMATTNVDSLSSDWYIEYVKTFKGYNAVKKILTHIARDTSVNIDVRRIVRITYTKFIDHEMISVYTQEQARPDVQYILDDGILLRLVDYVPDGSGDASYYSKDIEAILREEGLIWD